ncbi:DinB family protein [Hymenobacter lucidus]|uniref:DinB family protein n=1 Tax=Hymenobacter lucidus TaxID=2880930 RepID=A0ABS8ATQ6_9BACT|nr:DinB family protein [Hymenobacter lucidus]MCB2408789.1 DinB family protein [Hymenobacter lucidus]
MTRTFRTGAIGALLDEYERAIADLRAAIAPIPNAALPRIIDARATDESCRSIQAILTHVVSSGYGYATSIHNLKGPARTRPAKALLPTIDAYRQALTEVFAFTEQVFQGFSDQDLEQLDPTRKIRTGWGQLYDIEQLMEHAIVHILRHRRQLEKIRQQLASPGKG